MRTKQEILTAIDKLESQNKVHLAEIRHIKENTRLNAIDRERLRYFEKELSNNYLFISGLKWVLKMKIT